MDQTDSNNDKLKEEFESLQEEMSYLLEDLDAADEEVEELTTKIKKLEEREAIILTKPQVIEEIKGILKDSVHNVNLCTPSIADVEHLDLISLPSSLVIKVSCNFDLTEPKHLMIYDELKSMDNISLRLYTIADRFSIMKDRDCIFFGILGLQPNHILSFKATDAAHIKLLNNLITESWLRAKRIN
jgi:hypothetical protein